MNSHQLTQAKNKVKCIKTPKGNPLSSLRLGKNEASPMELTKNTIIYRKRTSSRNSTQSRRTRTSKKPSSARSATSKQTFSCPAYDVTHSKRNLHGKIRNIIYKPLLKRTNLIPGYMRNQHALKITIQKPRQTTTTRYTSVKGNSIDYSLTKSLNEKDRRILNKNSKNKTKHRNTPLAYLPSHRTLPRTKCSTANPCNTLHKRRPDTHIYKHLVNDLKLYRLKISHINTFKYFLPPSKPLVHIDPKNQHALKSPQQQTWTPVKHKLTAVKIILTAVKDCQHRQNSPISTVFQLDGGVTLLRRR